MAGGRIDYTVGFKVDTTQLNSLKTQLQQLSLNVNQLYANNAGKSIIDTQKFNSDVGQVKSSITQLEGALTRAFNTQLGTLNITKFNQELKGLNLSKIQADMASLGAQGQNAFRSIAAAALSTNMQLKQSHTFLRSMADTMANTLKWGVASSVMNTFAGTVRKAYGYVKDLDRSLNDIQIVTKQSSEDMERFAKQANKAAKELHASTTAYTQAALIYAQQGLQGQELEARTDVTMKVANVTGVDAEEASEYLTAVWNGYKVSAEETELYVDKLANVAAHTASNLEELSTGMSKVASAANIMGVDVDQLNAQLSTIISVTREAPETIGTSLKTVYARMADIEAGLDEETTLGNYTSGMAELGINVLDAQGKLRDTGEVIEEIGGKWETMTREQQIALARTIAGQRQYSRMLSLFDNWDKYNEALEYSKNATGELQDQQDIYAESIKAHLADLQVASQGLYANLMDGESLNSLVDGLTTVVELLDNFVQVIGGGKGALQLLGMIAMKVFNQHIINGLTTTIQNFQTAKYNAKQMAAEMKVLAEYEKAANNSDDPRLKRIVEMKKQILKYSKSISAEDRETLNQMIKQTEELYKQGDALKEKQKKGSAFFNRRTGDSANLSTEKGIEETKNSANAIKLQLDDQKNQVDGLTSAIQNETNARRVLSQAEIESVNATNLVKQAKNELNNAIKKYGEDSEQTRIAREKLTQAEQNATNIQKNLTNAQNDAKNASLQKINVLRTLLEQTKQNIEFNHLDLQTQEELEPIFKDLSQSMNSYEKLLQKNNLTKAQAAKLDSLKMQIDRTTLQLQMALTNGIDRESKEYQELINTLNTLTAELNENIQAQENAKHSFDNFASMAKLKNGIQNMMGFVQGLSSITMGINSLGNAWNALHNPDLSGWEKFSQVMMGLSMGLPMVVSGFSNMGKVFGLNTILTQRATASSYQYQLSLALQAHSIDTVTKAEEIHAAVEAGSMTVEDGAIALRALHTGANYGLAASFKAATAAAQTFLASIGPLGWAIMALTAIVGVFAALVIFGDKETELEKAKRKLEETNEAFDSATKAAEKTNQAYEDLLSTLDNYKSMRKNIDSLTTGTQEWEQATSELNQQVLELIKQYPVLSQYITSMNGSLSITQKGQEVLLEEQMKRAESQNNLLVAAQIAQEEAQLELFKAEKKKDVQNTDYRAFDYDNLIATGGEYFNFVSTLYDKNGAGADLTTYAKDKDITSKEIKELFEKRQYGNYENGLANYKEELLADIQGNNYRTDEEKEKFTEERIEAALDDSFKYLSGEIESLSFETYEALGMTTYNDEEEKFKINEESVLAMQLLRDTIIARETATQEVTKEIKKSSKLLMRNNSLQQTLLKSKSFQQADKKDQTILQAVGVSSQVYNDAFQSGYDYVNNLLANSGDSKGKGDEKTLGQILTLLGVSYQEGSIEDNGSKFTFVDLEGETQTMTNSQIMEAYGQQEAKKAMESSAGQNKVLKEYEAASAGLTDDMKMLLDKGIVSGGKIDISGLALDEINEAYSLIFGDEKWDPRMTKSSKQDLAKLFGFDKYGDFQKSLKDAFNSQEIVNSLITRAKTAIESTQETDISLSKLSSGETLADEDLTLLAGKEQKYSQLQEIVDLLGEEARYTHEYIDNLREINELEEQNARADILAAKETSYATILDLQQKINDTYYEEYYDDLTGETVQVVKTGIDQAAFEEDINNLNQMLETFLNANYELQIAIQADFDSDIKNAFGLGKEFEKLKEMISEDFTLTMEEAQTIIANGYGEILQNATSTADGQIQLNNVVANSYIDEKQRELDADKEARTQELLRQRDIYVAQEEILQNKLTALQNALNAEDAAQAAQFLQQAQDLDAQYQNKVLELNQELNDVNTSADEEANINKNLYDRLNGMHRDSAQDQLNADKEGANKEKAILDQRIENVKVLYNAWKTVGDKIANPTGDIEWAPGTTTDASGQTMTEGEEIDAGESYQIKEVTAADLKELGLTDTSGTLNEEYKNTINKLIRDTEADINLVQSNIGAIDAAIAAMRGSSLALDKAQGGSGSGSGDKKELFEDELDIYHDINREIEKLSSNLEILEKIQERSSGRKLINNLNEQIKILKEQNKAYEEKIALQITEAANYKNSLMGKGVLFDSEGDISNYNELLQQKQNNINNLIQNGASEEKIEQAEKEYEILKKEMERYEELLYNEIEETKKAMQDLYDKIIEMQIEKFTIDIELQTNFADIKNEWLELRDSILYSEKAFGQTAATAMSGLKDSMAGVYDTLADVEYMQGELAKIEAGQESELFGNNSKIANETINDTIETTQEWIEKSLDYIETIEEAAISAMEEIVDLQGQMIDSYDNLISALEHKISLKELLGGDGADTLDELNETFSIQLDIVKTAQQNLEANRKYLAENGEWLKENNPEEYLKYVNNVLEAEEKVFSSVEEAITTLNDLFDKGIENMLKEVETAYAGALGWEELSTRWENDQELADLYLTSVQKEYELQKMLNKVNQDILDKQYDSIYAQQKLNDFKENYIKMLEKEGDLTQAQVDRMNKMYELTLLQIALEEAKNNKSSMKLTRDSQGNYVYQYTTDEAEVAKREQELADKKNEIYKQDIEDTKSAISDYISAGKDAQSEYMDLFESEEFKRYMELSAESVGRELTPEEQAELDTAREKAYDMLAERAQTSAKQMEAQRKSTLEGINNILKDVDLQEIDWTQDYDTIVDNLDENQLDALLDAGIDLRSSAFKSLFGFNSNTYLQDILSSENGVWNGYLNAVGSYGNNLKQVLQAVGSENLDSYYDNVDLIYQEVQTIQNEISTQAEMANKEYQLTQNTLKEAERIRKELEKDFSENGRLNDIMNTQLATLEDELLEVKKELKKQTRLLDPNSEDDSEDVVTGWINNNGIWSYADSSGKSVKGWNKLDWQGKQDWYMFDENGIMKTNEWIHNASGTWSYVNSAGQAVTGWQVLDWQGKNDWYHFDEEGTMSANKWIGDYFVGSGGQMLTNIWVGHNGMYYWVGSDGKWLNLPSWTSHGRPNDGYPIYEYDTGGYTGSWFNGSRDGRLAFLHQKELVLNEKDTPRILDAVKLVREISTGSIIKGFEAQMRNTLSSLENQLIGTYANIEGMAAAAKQSTDQMLEQAVHIDASFPSVKDAREIEEALNNLVNVASQYAYENNK